MKGLFFDIGNTLAGDPFPFAAPVVVDALINKGLLTPSEKEAGLAALTRANEIVDGLGFSHFWGEEAILVEALRSLALEVDGALVSQCLETYRRAAEDAYRNNPELVAMEPQDLRELLMMARNSNFVIGAISDERTESIPRYWVVLGTGDLFDVVVTSEEVGVGKPHRAIFEAALDRAKTPASASIYVGNDYHRDIEGARALNMRTVYYTKFNKRRPSEREFADLVTDDLADIVRILRSLVVT